MIFRTLVLSIFALTFSAVNADISPLPATATVYEDAEQGNTNGWGVYDNTPAGAAIANISDVDKDSNVIELLGESTKNGYRLGHNNANHANAWGETNSTIISWDSKFSESMVVYIPVETTDGFRYLYYTARNSDLGINANPTYIHHGIGGR